jgi:hypothetical protein
VQAGVEVPVLDDELACASTPAGALLNFSRYRDGDAVVPGPP